MIIEAISKLIISLALPIMFLCATPAHSQQKTKVYPVNTVVISKFSSTLRTEPYFKGYDIADIKTGERLTIIGESKDHFWIKVKKADGTTGWAAIKWVTTNDECKVQEYNHPLYWIKNTDQIDKHKKKCWNVYQEMTVENSVYDYTRKIPALEIDNNKKAYTALLVFDPDNKKYKDKLKFYNLPESKIKKIVAQRNKKRQIALQKQREKEAKRARKVAAQRKSRIKRLYRDTDEYWKVVVTPSYKMHIKCALFDKNDNVLVVDEQYVDAPFDEVIIRVPGGASDEVESVRCYGLH